MAVKKKVFDYPHPRAFTVSVKIYAEFGGADPENPTKLYPQKKLKPSGKIIIPTYTLSWARVVDLYNSGKLHPKSQKIVLEIMTKQRKVEENEDYAEEVGSLNTDQPIPAGDGQMITAMDAASVSGADGQSVSGLKQSTGDEDENLFDNESV